LSSLVNSVVDIFITKINLNSLDVRSGFRIHLVNSARNWSALGVLYLSMT